MRIRSVTLLCVLFAGCSLFPERPREAVVVRGATPAEDFDHLGAAAKLADRGDAASAIPHLKMHLKAHPDATMIRAYLAELLLANGSTEEARREFQRFVQSADDSLARRHLIHAHTKLMELAIDAEDDFAASCHRGAALVLLGAQADEDECEPILRQGIAALREARKLDPCDPRPLLALHDAHDLAGDHSATRITTLELKASLSDPAWTAAERERIRAME